MGALARFGRSRARRGRALPPPGAPPGALAEADESGISRRGFVEASVVAGGTLVVATACTPSHPKLSGLEWQSLDSAGNNPAHPAWGSAGSLYQRLGPARYADGHSKMVDGPNGRYISNRIFNDRKVSLISARGITPWAFLWGQFLDHEFALRYGGDRSPGFTLGEVANFPYDNADPLESFHNVLGVNFFNRSSAAPGTGVTNARQQVNVLPAFISASAIYGVSPKVLDWLREGPLGGNPAKKSPRLFLPGNYLPRADSRGNPKAAPPVEIGRLTGYPTKVVVAGSNRVNQTLAMIAVQTLFAREHNRLVSLLPDWVPPEDKFQIARAVVIAEQQWITYNEFLPTMGVTLPPYSGFKSSVNTGIVSEFSAVGYRAHTMVPYTVGVETEVSRYSAAQLAAFRAGEYFEFHNTVAVTGGKVKITVPIPIAFFNPDMLEDLGLGPVLQGLSLTPGHAIDSRLIANPVRSAHFALPGAATCNPQRLQQRIEGHITTPVGCSLGVNDLAATDLVRGRDQGMPSYNEFRAAYGLAPKTSFTAITGEATGEFPAGTGIDDPHSLDFVALYDVHGNRTTAQAGDAVRGVQRAPLAARLKAIYHSVDNLEAFAGATAETSVVGSDLGETQWTSWQRQYTALRDGDRFFYANNPALPFIKRQFGIDYRKSLGDLIALNTDIPRHEMASNVFLTPEAQ